MSSIILSRMLVIIRFLYQGIHVTTLWMGYFTSPMASITLDLPPLWDCLLSSNDSIHKCADVVLELLHDMLHELLYMKFSGFIIRPYIWIILDNNIIGPYFWLITRNYPWSDADALGRIYDENNNKQCMDASELKGTGNFDNKPQRWISTLANKMCCVGMGIST